MPIWVGNPVIVCGLTTFCNVGGMAGRRIHPIPGRGVLSVVACQVEPLQGAAIPRHRPAVRLPCPLGSETLACSCQAPSVSGSLHVSGCGVMRNMFGCGVMCNLSASNGRCNTSRCNVAFQGVLQGVLQFARGAKLIIPGCDVTCNMSEVYSKVQRASSTCQDLMPQDDV